MFNYWSMPCFYCTLRVNFSVAVFKTRTHLRRSFCATVLNFHSFCPNFSGKTLSLVEFRTRTTWVSFVDTCLWGKSLRLLGYHYLLTQIWQHFLGLKLTSNWSCTVIRAESKLLQQQSLLQKGILIGDRATRSDLAFCSTTRRISVKMREQMVFSLRQCHKQILA